MKNKIIITLIVGIITLSSFAQIEVNAEVLTKTQTSYKDSKDKNSFPATISYDDGEYYGTLSKNGSPTIISGTYTPEKSKYVYGNTWHDRPVRERESYSGLQESPFMESYDSETMKRLMDRLGTLGVTYRSSWTWEGSEGDNPKEWYSDSEGYTGYLTKIDQYAPGRYEIGWGTEYWKYPASKKGEPRPPIVVYWRTDKTKLEGPVTKPAVDTRVYRQNYSGTVKKRDKIAPVIKDSTYGWTALNSINITINATDEGGSGVSNIKLYDSNGTQIKSVNSNTLQYSYSPTIEGIKGFSAKATDGEGNISNTAKITVKIDKTAPTITGIPLSNWTNSDVSINLTAKDNLSGINSFLLKDGNKIIKNGIINAKKDTATIEYKITEEGVYNYKVYSDDNADNPEPRNYTEQLLDIKIDKTKPSANFNPNSKTWTKDNITIKVTPSDNLSGVKQWRYAISNDNGSTYGLWSSFIIGNATKDVTLTSEGINKIKVEVTDNAGNLNTVTSGSYQIDKTLPGGIYTPNSKSWTNENVVVGFNPSDNLSGVKQWRYTTSNDNGTTYSAWSSYIVGDTSKNITILEEGFNKIKVEVTDNADNLNTVISGTYQIDKTAPTAKSYDVTDRQEDTFTIDIIGVTDNGGSGVRSEEVKVWVDTPTGRKEKLYTPIKISDNNSKVVVSRLDFEGVTKTYYYQLTLVDNVGNSRTYSSKAATMIQNNLKANRIDIFDPRENRYVSQVISGLEYLAVVEVQNTGEKVISKEFDIVFKIDGIEKGIIQENKVLNKDEKRDYKFKFVADQENLNGNIYEGIADYNDSIYETNEDDNSVTSEKPYDTPRSDENPPIIPISPPGGDKLVDPPPIITVKLDLVAQDIDIVDLNSDTIISEVITDDEYRLRFKIKNNSSLALEYIDILNKTFTNKAFYDGVEKTKVIVTGMKKGEVKTVYQKFKVPFLMNDIVESVIPIRLDVDTSNSIEETDETNNTISKNKKVIGLKLTDYRIMESINPIVSLKYPIYTSSMPLRVKAGYNVTFNVDVLGKPDTVYSKVTDNNGKDYGIVEMNKVRDIDNVRSEWTYTFAPSMDIPDNTIVITQIYAKRNSFIYDYNLKENWNGDTLKIGGDAKDDIIIYRKY